MAVGAKAHIGMKESILQSLPRDAATTRLDFKWMGAAVKGGFHLGSMYLVSRIGVEAKENKDILDAAAARVKLLVGPWAIGCDGNCTPEQLAKTGWLKLVGATIFRPRQPTCKLGEGRTIDFFVVSLGLEPFVKGAFNINDAGLHPHSPARLIIGDRPREDKMRTMKVPMAHSVELPAGPQRECIPEATKQCTDEQLGSDYAGCVVQLEKELNQVAGLEGEQAQAFSGRVDGPQFVMKTVSSDKAAAARTTSASRAWRRAGGWIAQVGKAKGCKARLAACWKLFNYRHPKPNLDH